MGFVPQSKNHSLIEAVFGLALSRPWHPEEVSAIKKNDANWKEFLPRVNDTNLHEIVIGPNGVPAPNILPSTGVVYERIKPDGSIAWRLNIDQNNIFVNCLEYTSWNEVWRKAQELIGFVIEAVPNSGLEVAGLIYQTIDGFTWNGQAEDYRASHLLNTDGPYVPNGIDERGALWHLHQGWFDIANEPIAGRVLNRVHFDALEQGSKVVKMDTILQYVYDVHQKLSDGDIAGGSIEQAFSMLHEKNKTLLRNFLTPSILDTIELK